MVSSKAKSSFEPPPNSLGAQQMLAMAGAATLCASRRLEQEEGQHESQEREQTISKGERVAWARTAPVFMAVEAGDSGQLRSAGDTE